LRCLHAGIERARRPVKAQIECDVLGSTERWSWMVHMPILCRRAAKDLAWSSV
jgi:hypothetical protein